MRQGVEGELLFFFLFSRKNRDDDDDDKNRLEILTYLAVEKGEKKKLERKFLPLKSLEKRRQRHSR